MPYTKMNHLKTDRLWRVCGGYHIVISLPGPQSDGFGRVYYSPSVAQHCPDLPYAWLDLLYDATRSHRANAMQRDRDMMKRALRQVCANKKASERPEMLALIKRAKAELGRLA